MRKRWSLGIGSDVTDRMTLLAAGAYKNVSKLPRLAGLGLGLIAAAGIDAAYLFGGMRRSLEAFNLPWPAMAGIDLLLVAGTGFIAESVSRLVTKKSLRGLFEKLMPKDQLHKISPRTGAVNAWAYAASAAIFAGLIMAGLSSGNPVPEWAALLLKK